MTEYKPSPADRKPHGNTKHGRYVGMSPKRYARRVARANGARHGNFKDTHTPATLKAYACFAKRMAAEMAGVKPVHGNIKDTHAPSTLKSYASVAKRKAAEALGREPVNGNIGKKHKKRAVR